ncbi:MAG: DUF4382 domain-containing protein [Sulfolobaceae archaeon]|nr:DUF4382 domain-containing protein [Sulfolobaceae archaeon]
MMKSSTIVVIVVILLILIGYVVYSNFISVGTVNVYVQDAPSSSGLFKIYLTVSSIMLHKVSSSGNGSWITVSNKTTTILLSSNMSLLASAKVPVGSYNEVFLVVTSATVQIGNTNVTVTVPSGVFKIHIINGMRISGGSTTNLLISFPHITYANGQLIISPSITAQVIS